MNPNAVDAEDLAREADSSVGSVIRVLRVARREGLDVNPIGLDPECDGVRP